MIKANAMLINIISVEKVQMFNIMLYLVELCTTHKKSLREREGPRQRTKPAQKGEEREKSTLKAF